MSRPAALTHIVAIGTRLTDYSGVDLTVEGFAGGGMGLVVWGPNAAREGHRVEALKLLRPERVAAAQSPEHRRAIERQFEDEALVWCHLWPHQCVITASGLTRLSALDNLPVLALVYAPNGSLRDQLRLGREQRNHPSLETALAWAIHIASALAHIHQPDPDHDRPAPLVHCDLKPENVLFDEHGWAQLTDLGLTRAYAALTADAASATVAAAEASDAPAPGAGPLTSRHAEVARLRAILQAAGALPADQAGSGAAATLFATHTLRIPSTQALPPLPSAASSSPSTASPSAAAIGSRGPAAGTPPYMAPEQWLGLDAVVPATDVYAFGVLLYELFAGTECMYRFPFDPTSFLTPALVAHARATGYDPILLAWHAAHTTPGGLIHRLTDPEVADTALTSGPLTKLMHRGDAAGQDAAMDALRQLDAVIVACLAPDPAARPDAGAVRQMLAALATRPCGLEPDAIPTPGPIPSTPTNEGNFWSNLGMTYGKLNRHEEALAALRLATQRDPTDAVNWLNLGSALYDLAQEDHQQSETAAAAGQSQQAGAHAEAARQHWEEAFDAYQQAEAHITPQVLAAFPTLVTSLVSNQAAVLGDLGRYAEAVAAYQRALTLQPDKYNTRFNLAVDYARWSQVQVPDTTPEERVERLQAAQREIRTVLAAAPNFTQAQALAQRIARALADPEHRFRG